MITSVVKTNCKDIPYFFKLMPQALKKIDQLSWLLELKQSDSME